MTKIDIFSGFLGAGKTTLIKKLIEEAFKGEKLVLIENEFGEIGIDGGFLKEAGVQINEMNSGCICCSLVGDFEKALGKVLEDYAPDRIIIEPSGVGKLSDVIKAVQAVVTDKVCLNGFVTVADATKCKMYIKNFGEFYLNQIEYASTIVLSRTQNLSQEKLDAALALIREHNSKARVVTTPWSEISGKNILTAIEGNNSFTEDLLKEAEVCPTCGHHHHDHDEHEHEHHHDHDHDEHEHHHHHDGSCSCGHDHDADDVFISWGTETPRKYTEEEIHAALSGLDNAEQCGIVLRAKGIVPCTDGTWIHFDYVPGEQNVRRGPASFTGRLCVIGSELKEHELEHLFCLH